MIKFVIFEGPDCSGKTTQATELWNNSKLIKNGIFFHFPITNGFLGEQIPEIHKQMAQTIYDRDQLLYTLFTNHNEVLGYDCDNTRIITQLIVNNYKLHFLNKAVFIDSWEKLYSIMRATETLSDNNKNIVYKIVKNMLSTAQHFRLFDKAQNHISHFAPTYENCVGIFYENLKRVILDPHEMFYIILDRFIYSGYVYNYIMPKIKLDEVSELNKRIFMSNYTDIIDKDEFVEKFGIHFDYFTNGIDSKCTDEESVKKALLNTSKTYGRIDAEIEAMFDDLKKQNPDSVLWNRVKFLGQIVIIHMMESNFLRNIAKKDDNRKFDSYDKIDMQDISSYWNNIGQIKCHYIENDGIDFGLSNFEDRRMYNMTYINTDRILHTFPPLNLSGCDVDIRKSKLKKSIAKFIESQIMVSNAFNDL